MDIALYVMKIGEDVKVPLTNDQFTKILVQEDEQMVDVLGRFYKEMLFYKNHSDRLDPPQTYLSDEEKKNLEKMVLKNMFVKLTELSKDKYRLYMP